MNRVLWFEDFVAPAAVALMEATWLSLWFNWLGRQPAFLPQTGGSILPFWIVVGLVLGGNLTGRLALNLSDAGGPARPARRPAEMNRARQIVAGAGLLAVAVALWGVYGGGLALWSPAWLGRYAAGLASNWTPVPPQALSLLAAMYLWRRGIRAGQNASREAHEDLRRTFYTGLAGMGLALLLAAPEPGRAGPGLAAGEIAGAALLYFAVGLSALALASASHALRQAEQVANSRVTLNRYWLGASAGVVAFVLVGGLLAGWLVTPEPIRAIFAALTPVVRLVGAGLLFAFLVLAAGMLLIAQIIAPIIFRLLTLIQALPGPDNPPLQPPTIQQFTEQVNQWINNVPAARLLLNILAVVVLIGGIGFIFWLALDRLTRRRAPNADETRESIATPALIGRQLLDLLRRLRPNRAGQPFMRLDGPPLDPRTAVRRAYQMMLAWAADTLGEPRAPGQTPAAYATRLTGRAPTAAPDLAVLTAAYLKARYSAQAPTSGEAAAAQRAAAQIRQIKRTAEG